MKSAIKKHMAFSLVELMIVIAILGILAAIIVPEFQGHSQRAKEAAAKDNLRILRQAIEYYAIEHDGVPPGYTANDPTRATDGGTFLYHLTIQNHYLSDMPANPFTNKDLVKAYQNNETLPAAPELTDTFGWLYHPATKQIRLNYPGTDSQGKSYYEY